MYSDTVLGWPLTSIRPSRCTSTPTDSMLVQATKSSVARSGRPVASWCKASGISLSRRLAESSLTPAPDTDRGSPSACSRAGMSSRASESVLPSSRLLL
ncbi:hypothetical protein D3C87_1677390 [compost metagenome]